MVLYQGQEYLRGAFDLGTYEVTDFSYEEAMKRVLFMKDVIEKNDGYSFPQTAGSFLHSTNEAKVSSSLI